MDWFLCDIGLRHERVNKNFLWKQIFRLLEMSFRNNFILREAAVAVS